MNGHQRGTRSRALKDLVASYFTPTRQYRQRLTSSRMRSGTYSIRSMRGQCARSRMDGDIDGGPRMPPPRSPDDHSGYSGNCSRPVAPAIELFPHTPWRRVR